MREPNFIIGGNDIKFFTLDEIKSKLEHEYNITNIRFFNADMATIFKVIETISFDTY